MPIKSAHVAASAPGATFHPKVYGFVSNHRVAILVGSSNFTYGGTHSNKEASLLLEGTMQDQPLEKLLSEVARWWTAGIQITPKFVEAYERRYAATQPYRNALAHKLFVPHPKSDAKHPRLLSLNWSEYIEELKVYGVDHLNRRVALLRRASEIFVGANSFAEISSLERKALGGFIGLRERDASLGLANVDWAWFGSMMGSGVFKNRVSDPAGRANQHISAALYCIAPTGVVTEADYKRVVECFRNAFTGAARQGQIASASRLLAMKRPDYFLCVNKENSRRLSQDLGFSAGMVNFETYWKYVVEPLMSATWWQARRPGGYEGRIWDGRAAMLDAIYYVPR